MQSHDLWIVSLLTHSMLKGDSVIHVVLLTNCRQQSIQGEGGMWVEFNSFG